MSPLGTRSLGRAVTRRPSMVLFFMSFPLFVKRFAAEQKSKEVVYDYTLVLATVNLHEDAM
jgi:hypothetical protein